MSGPPPNSSLTLNLVVPVYNEGENFTRLFDEIRSKIRLPFRLYVVYDFDEDNTLPVARRLQQEDGRIILVKNRFGRGVLNAIVTGFKAAGEGPVLVIMADLSDDLAVVETMIEKYREGYKVVCGSRYMKGGKQIGGPLLKRTLSRFAGLSLHYVFGVPVHDVTNSFKLYDRDLLNEITIESRGGFELGMEITLKAHRMGYPICEVPSVWTDRAAGESKFKLWRWLPHYLKWYFFAIRSRIKH
jgi:glycosyltransferase involved in cell wall biosynthesis